jgi:hypothetical protein
MYINLILDTFHAILDLSQIAFVGVEVLLGVPERRFDDTLSLLIRSLTLVSEFLLPLLLLVEFFLLLQLGLHLLKCLLARITSVL